MDAITVKIPKPLGARLKALARKQGATKSELVRRAIEALLNSPDGANLSVHDLASDLCGIVKGTPPDLSTNSRHTDGFGE